VSEFNATIYLHSSIQQTLSQKMQNQKHVANQKQGNKKKITEYKNMDNSKKAKA